MYFFNSGKCDTILSVYAQRVPGVGSKRNPASDPHALDSQRHKRECLFNFLSVKGNRISASSAVKKVAKSIYVCFETSKDSYDWFELTGPRNISEFIDFVETVPESNPQINLNLNQAVLYSLELNQTPISDQSATGAEKQNFNTDSNLVKTRHDHREKLFKYLLKKANRVSESLANDRILESLANYRMIESDKEIANECRSWKK